MAANLDRVLIAVGAEAAANRRSRSKLCVLAYHGIDDPDNFERQLVWLRQHTNPVSLDDLESDGQLPKSPVLLTFDDGERSLVERGLPLLRKYAFPAVAFVLPGLIGTDIPFWWREVEHIIRVEQGRSESMGEPHHVVRRLKLISDDDRLAAIAALRASSDAPTLRQPQLTTADLRELDACGVRVESHSATHPLLDQCDEATIEHEVRSAHDQLEKVLQRPPKAFAYPNGNTAPAAVRVLRTLDYKSAFIFDHKLTPWPPRDYLAISRVRVNSHTRMDRFRLLTSGLHSVLHHLRGRT